MAEDTPRGQTIPRLYERAGAARDRTLCIVLGAQVLTRDGLCFAETELLPQGFITGDFGYLWRNQLFPAENIGDSSKRTSSFSEARALLEESAQFWETVKKWKAENYR